MGMMIDVAQMSHTPRNGERMGIIDSFPATEYVLVCDKLMERIVSHKRQSQPITQQCISQSEIEVTITVCLCHIMIV